MKKAIKVFYYNVGSCNGCDIEVVAGVLLTENGIKLKITEKPEEADVCVFTGILTKKIKPYFDKVIKKLPKRAKIIAFGSCAISGNAFFESPTFTGPIDKYIKVDLYVNGCPPKADTAVAGALAEAGLYPKNKVEVNEGSRWRGELKFYPKKCIGCLNCVYYCPARTIKVLPDNQSKTGRPRAEKTFSAQGGSASGWKLSYNFERCFFCSMCQRVCPTEAIVLTHKSVMVKKKRGEFKTEGPVTRGRGRKK